MKKFAIAIICSALATAAYMMINLAYQTAESEIHTSHHSSPRSSATAPKSVQERCPPQRTVAEAVPQTTANLPTALQQALGREQEEIQKLDEELGQVQGQLLPTDEKIAALEVLLKTAETQMKNLELEQQKITKQLKQVDKNKKSQRKVLSEKQINIKNEIESLRTSQTLTQEQIAGFTNQKTPLQVRIDSLIKAKQKHADRLEKMQALLNTLPEGTTPQPPTTGATNESDDRNLQKLDNLAREFNKNFAQPVVSINKVDHRYAISFNGQALFSPEESTSRVNEARSTLANTFWREVIKLAQPQEAKLLAGTGTPFSQISALTNYLQTQLQLPLIYEPAKNAEMAQRIQIEVKAGSSGP